MAEYLRDEGGPRRPPVVDNIFRFSQAGSEVSALLGPHAVGRGLPADAGVEMGALQERITSTDNGSITSVQAIYAPGRRPDRPAPATAFTHSTPRRCSPGNLELGIYPAVDPLDRRRGCWRRSTWARSTQGRPGRAADPPGYKDLQDIIAILGMDELSEGQGPRPAGPKIQKFLSQPFFVAEQFTGIPGRYVKLSDTIKSFKAVVAGDYDHLPEQAFYMKGRHRRGGRRAEQSGAKSGGEGASSTTLEVRSSARHGESSRRSQVCDGPAWDRVGGADRSTAHPGAPHVGQLGIFPRHAPLVAALAAESSASACEGGTVARFAVSGGFLKVGDNRVHDPGRPGPPEVDVKRRRGPAGARGDAAELQHRDRRRMFADLLGRHSPCESRGRTADQSRQNVVRRRGVVDSVRHPGADARHPPGPSSAGPPGRRSPCAAPAAAPIHHPADAPGARQPAEAGLILWAWTASAGRLVAGRLNHEAAQCRVGVARLVWCCTIDITPEGPADEWPGDGSTASAVGARPERLSTRITRSGKNERLR